MGFFSDYNKILLQTIKIIYLKPNYFFIFIEITSLLDAQISKIWFGKVVSEITELLDIFVLNKRNTIMKKFLLVDLSRNFLIYNDYAK